MNPPEGTPRIEITAEMMHQAMKLRDEITVNRTRENDQDAVIGALGEFAFAEWKYGDWRKNNVGKSKGKHDFKGGIEIKTSARKYSPTLHLMVREDYAQSRIANFYVQALIDAEPGERIGEGCAVFLVGFCKGETVKEAAVMDFWGAFRVKAVPFYRLSPMEEFN